jgi:hypothetical protein
MKQMGDAQVMDNVDLNLLVALDTLLAEGRVTGAARRLGLSSSAMSPTLTRRRSATGGPLVVRAGRGLVPTPRAEKLRDRSTSLPEMCEHSMDRRGSKLIEAVSGGWPKVLSDLKSLLETGSVIWSNVIKIEDCRAKA